MRDIEFETHIHELILVVKEYPKDFPDYLPDIPPERVIVSRIDFLMDTQYISISPYRMAQVELKEHKD